MKQIFSTLFVTISLFSWSQIKITEPTEIGAFVYVDKSDGAGISLEKNTSRASSSTSIAGAATTLTISGATSTIQIKKHEIMQFVYRIDKSKSGESLKTFKLVVLTPEKKSRKITTSIHPINAEKSIYPTIIGGLVTEPYGENSMLISANGLPIGEYAFVSGDQDLTKAYFDSELKFFYTFTVIE